MGRRATYSNPDDMQAVIYQYFEGCKSNGGDRDKESWKESEITNDIHPSILGLCLALGIGRNTLIDYGEKEEFSNTVEQAKLEIESYNVQRLYDSQVAGVKFVLINGFNWKDKQEVEHTGDMSNNGGICRASEILREFRGSGQGDSVAGDVQG